MLRSLELRTEAMLMAGVSDFDDRGDHVIQRTPSEPDYWEGNRVILRESAVTAAQAIGWHRVAFPDASHLCFAFDIPDLSLAAVDPGFEAEGVGLEAADTLVLTKDLSPAARLAGLTLRPLSSDEDWERAHKLGQVWAEADGYDLASHDGFSRRRNARRRAQIAEGRGAWIGAFDGDDLVGQTGIFMSEGLARYQEVQTAETHRRRGIASALLVVAGRWARARKPGVPLVIVADEGTPAGRLYRQNGFALAETLLTGMKRGY